MDDCPGRLGTQLSHGVAVARPAEIRVMTQNMNKGTDLLEVLAAATVPAFVAAVPLAYDIMLTTTPAARAAAMANEIVTRKPLLIGWQEDSILPTGSAPPASTVVFDLPQLLLEEGQAGGGAGHGCACQGRTGRLDA
jgi:hypothetical protein